MINEAHQIWYLKFLLGAVIGGHLETFYDAWKKHYAKMPAA